MISSGNSISVYLEDATDASGEVVHYAMIVILIIINLGGPLVVQHLQEHTLMI